MLTVTVLALLVGSTFAATTVELLQADGRFSTLVNLVVQAGLVDTLNGGTFTIFAPTNDAFAKVPSDTLAFLQSNTTALTDVLTYHVSAGSVPSSAVKDELLLPMVNGGNARLNVYSHNSLVTIAGCTISQVDLNASNGVIHVIDSVMMQPRQDIVEAVIATPELSTLLGLVQQAGLASALQGDALTVFAPTNAAFSKVPAATLSQITSDPQTLASVLTYHVVPSTEFSAGLYKNEHLSTLNTDNDLTVHFIHHGADIKINNAAVTSADIQTTNGVVHLIDHVLLPDLNGPAAGRK